MNSGIMVYCIIYFASSKPPSVFRRQRTSDRVLASLRTEQAPPSRHPVLPKVPGLRPRHSVTRTHLAGAGCPGGGTSCRRTVSGRTGRRRPTDAVATPETTQINKSRRRRLRSASLFSVDTAKPGLYAFLGPGLLYTEENFPARSGWR